MTSTVSTAGMQKTYAIWAKFYDYIYKRLFYESHRVTAEFAGKAGLQLLEVGFGTGLLLPYYSAHCRLTGIDLSYHMLQRAQEKLRLPDIPDVNGFCVMDAARLAFRNDQFDAVVFPFVIALVPDYRKALNEAARVLRPGGRIVITNRFGAEHGWQARVENLLAPLAEILGWSCNFKLSYIDDWARSAGMKIIDRKEGYFKVIALEKPALDRD